jgi:hypothetical protein
MQVPIWSYYWVLVLLGWYTSGLGYLVSSSSMALQKPSNSTGFHGKHEAQHVMLVLGWYTSGPVYLVSSSGSMAYYMLIVRTKHKAQYAELLLLLLLLLLLP